MNLLRKLLLEKKGKRAPFLKVPLNAPGASLLDQMNDKVDSFALMFVSLPTISLFLLFSLPFVEEKSTYISLSLLIFVGWLLWLFFFGKKIKEDLRTTRLGYLGEVLVGQELERTRACGCSVYHDIVFDKGRSKFNIDHILIGEVGVVVFETKARVKPLRGDTKIWIKNGELFFSDGQKSTKELEQSRRNGETVQKLLLQLINDSNKASLRKFTPKNPFPLENCLVFPGWYVNYKSAFGSDVNLSNDAMVFNFVSSQCGRNKRLSQKESADLNEIFDTYLRQKKESLIEV